MTRYDGEFRRETPTLRMRAAAWLRQGCLPLLRTRSFKAVLILVCLVGALLFGRDALQATRYLQLAQSQNVVARQEALVMLGRLGSRRALPLLETTAADTALDLQTRQAAIAALGDIGAPGSLDALVGLLDNAPPEIVEAAVVELGRLGDGRAVGPLVRLVREKRARLPALWSLGAIGDPRAVPLLNLELSDPDVYVAYNARQALKRIAGQSHGS